MFSESVRVLLVKAPLLDVGHGEHTDVCLDKNGHIHMGKIQIKKNKKILVIHFFLLTSYSA